MRHRLAYITSLRELAGDEQVGRVVVDAMTGARYGYRAGTLERLVERLRRSGDPVARTFELAAVVIDDDDRELADSTRQAPPWPDDLVSPDLVLRAPSTWRRLVAHDGETVVEFRARKRAAKARYESVLRAALERRGVDVILSDSYVVLFGPDLLEGFGGRILNVHPGVLDPGHPAHTPGRTPTRDAWTRAVHGFVIVDDKRSTPVPPGPQRLVEFEGARRRAVLVPRVAMAGVSVHVVTAEVDGGPVLAAERWSFEPAGITPERIRHTNYELKHRVVPRALLRWAAARQPSLAAA